MASGLAHSSGSASVDGEARKGGTLRLASLDDVTVDTALAYSPTSAPVGFATCAKLFNHPDAEEAKGTDVIKEVVKNFAVSRDRRTYTFDLHRGFRFHTGAPVTAQSFADAFTRDAQPDLESPARGFMREIVGARAVIDGKAASISGIRVLGRYRLQIRLTRPVGDFTTRLTMGFFCPILPDTPIAEIDDPAGSGPYYVYERESPISASCSDATRSTGEGARRTSTRSCGRSATARRLACLPSSRIGSTTASLSAASPQRRTEVWPRSAASTDQTGSCSSRPGLSTWYYAFNHDRPAFDGPGQIPLKKAINFAIDRLALTRPAGYLAGKRTDQILPPALARSASIYPLGGPNLAAARASMPGHATSRPRSSSTRRAPLLRRPGPVARVRPGEAGYRPRGEVLRPRGDGPEGGDARRAVRPRPTGLDCRLRRWRQLPRDAPLRQEHQGDGQPQPELLRRPRHQRQNRGGGQAHG